MFYDQSFNFVCLKSNPMKGVFLGRKNEKKSGSVTKLTEFSTYISRSIECHFIRCKPVLLGVYSFVS